MVNFGPKDYQSSEVFTFDFTELVGDSGLTISSVAITNEVISGIDASPSAMLSGAAQISGLRVLQRLVSGTQDVSYHLRCKATMSDGSILVIASDLSVEKF